MKRDLSGVKFTLVFIAVALAFIVIGRMDETDAAREASHYCQMVEAHQRDPSVGWPDYRHSFKRDCASQGGDP